MQKTIDLDDMTEEEVEEMYQDWKGWHRRVLAREAERLGYSVQSVCDEEDQ